MEVPLPSGTLAVLAFQRLGVIHDVLHIMLSSDRDTTIRLVLPEPFDSQRAIATEMPPAHLQVGVHFHRVQEGCYVRVYLRLRLQDVELLIERPYAQLQLP